MKHIVYIHGLNASHRSFNYIIQKLPRHNHVAVEYSSYQSLTDSIDSVRRQLPQGELVLVGHSLGGVVSVLLAAEDERIKRVVTISSPLSGSKEAATMRWFYGMLPIWGDIIPRCPYMTKTSSIQLKIPALSIISTGGNMPMISEPNDSVVTIESQKALKFGKKVEIKANHFEILMDDRTVKAIGDFALKEPGILYENQIEEITQLNRGIAANEKSAA